MLRHSFASGADAFLELTGRMKSSDSTGYEYEQDIFVFMRLEDGDWRVIEYGNLRQEKNFESEEFLQWMSPAKVNEAAAASTLRTINTTLVTYSTTYPDAGFPPSFKELSGNENDEFSQEHARLLDSRFNQEQVIIDGYEFRYVRSGDGYQVTATPVEYGKTGSRSFFSDESVVLRTTSENRSANENDDPLD
jgi:hypothetical protein